MITMHLIIIIRPDKKDRTNVEFNTVRAWLMYKFTVAITMFE